MIETHRLSASFGVEVIGIDLRAEPNPATVGMLRDAIVEHHLVVLRAAAPYSAADQVRWTRPFGEVETYPSSIPHQLAGLPEVLRLTNVPGCGYLNSAEFWHQDGTFRDFPTDLSFFNMAVRPERGDATLFTNVHDAYEQLPDALRAVVDTSGATQNNGCWHRQHRPHPVTGRSALVVNVGYTASIDALRPEDTQRFLVDIAAYLDGLETYAHRWMEGDLVIADNAAMAHRAEPEVPVGERTLLRTCTEGTVTF